MIELNLGEVNSIEQLYREANIAHLKTPTKSVYEYTFKVNENKNLRNELKPIVRKQLNVLNELGFNHIDIYDITSDKFIGFKTIFVDEVGHVEFLD